MCKTLSDQSASTLAEEMNNIVAAWSKLGYTISQIRLDPQAGFTSNEFKVIL